MELTIKINRRNKREKAFYDYVKSLDYLDVVEKKEAPEPTKKSPYNPEFVKKIQKAKKRGDYTTLDVNDIWGSLGLK
ncbi:MAG: hypothetical protein Q4G08_00015 [Capnocytophaga sp.]|nr:hypothetical protein [Capnocytophaga sp.]MDO5606816.1 hypothetical protein [Capnocytophaga sp.]